MKTNPIPPSSCWLQNDVFFYVTVVAFVLLILLCNISVFIMVLIQIRQMRANKPSANRHSSLQDLRAVARATSFFKKNTKNEKMNLIATPPSTTASIVSIKQACSLSIYSPSGVIPLILTRRVSTACQSCSLTASDSL